MEILAFAICCDSKRDGWIVLSREFSLPDFQSGWISVKSFEKVG